ERAQPQDAQTQRRAESSVARLQLLVVRLAHAPILAERLTFLNQTRRLIGMSQSAAAKPPRSLWRDGNFLTLWTGQALSQFGEQIAGLAIPVLAVLLLNATEFEVGLLNAAAVAAFLVVGLPA